MQIEQDFESLHTNLYPLRRYESLEKCCEKCRPAIITAASVLYKKISQRNHKELATSFFNLAKSK